MWACTKPSLDILSIIKNCTTILQIYNTNNVSFHTSSFHYRTTDVLLLRNFYTFKLLIPQLSATLHLNKKSLLKLKII